MCALPTSILTAIRVDPKRRRLAFPLAASTRGGLACIDGERAAVRQLLGLVRDLALDEYPGLPLLHNPCDLARGESDAERIVDLCRRLQVFLAGQKVDTKIVWNRPASLQSRNLGWIEIRKDEAWILKLRVELHEGIILWMSEDIDRVGV